MAETLDPRIARPWLRALSNALLGVAVGLLAYYGVTDLANAADQRRLAVELGGVGPARGLPQVLERKAVGSLDLSGWEAEDAAYWRDLPEGEAFGRLVSEEMGLDRVVVKGAGTADLRKGPGWIPGTSLPGKTGNVGIAGHRTTYGQPFARIDRLERGDEIALYSPFRRYRYEVVGLRIVEPDDVEVIRPTGEPTLTLTACHPPYSARYRIIAQARLVEVSRLRQSADRDRE